MKQYLEAAMVYDVIRRAPRGLDNDQVRMMVRGHRQYTYWHALINLLDDGSITRDHDYDGAILYRAVS